MPVVLSDIDSQEELVALLVERDDRMAELAHSIVVEMLGAGIVIFEKLLKAAIADKSLEMVAMLSACIDRHRLAIETANREFSKLYENHTRDTGKED